MTIIRVIKTMTAITTSQMMVALLRMNPLVFAWSSVKGEPTSVGVGAGEGVGVGRFRVAGAALEVMGN